VTTIASLRRQLAECARRVPPRAEGPSSSMTTSELRHAITDSLGIDEDTLAVIGPGLKLAIVAEIARRDRGIRG